jgi:hypothetical protein
MNGPYQCDLPLLEQTYCHPPVLAVTLRWIAVERQAEDQLGIQEIQAVLHQIGEPFALVPLAPHAAM